MEKGEIAYGILVALPSPIIIEMTAYAGFDFAIIDLEHGAISVESLENMIRATEATGLCPFVRVRDSQQESILLALDRGAQGIVVPHLKSPEQALMVSRASRFHPMGSRGMASAGRSAGFGALSPEEFFNTANQETILMLMIEDKEGVEQIDEILSVEGIDMIMAGAGDLAQAYGYPGQPSHPKIREIISKVFATAQKAGIPFCAIVKDITGANIWKEKGVNCFLVGDDQRIIFNAFATLLASIKG